MITTEPGYYFAGGTLRHDAPSYVERQADTDLYEGLQHGEFCYILTSRQMGKSSLMARIAARLRQEGVAVAILDLAAIGQNLTVEQWYDGLLGRLGRHLDLEDELEEYWLDHERQSPLQRWMGALREVVLPSLESRRPKAEGSREGNASWINHHGSRLVIFIDEIDAVRSLPFSTDEFFAAIRECYNLRSEDAQLNRLTFCLLGVASPSDLIQDTRTTPFNIGRRIELNDFTDAEARPLAKGLVPTASPHPPLPGKGSRASPFLVGGADRELGSTLLKRILYWTKGHPYLTQRLCQAVAKLAAGPTLDTLHPTPDDVDRHCQELFLSPRAREGDTNLLFVRESLLRSRADLAGLLDLYGQVRGGKRVRPDDTNPLLDLLRLSGVVRQEQNRLVVRNRIYGWVFDRAWVTQHMPDAELRRQRTAHRRGVLQASGIAGTVLALVGILALTALQARDHALRAKRSAEAAREANRYRLVRQFVNRGMRLVEDGDLFGALPYVVEAHRLDREAGRPDQIHRMRLAALLRRVPRLVQLWHHGDLINRAEFSRDGRRVLTASWDRTARVWDAVTGRAIGRPLKTANRGMEGHELAPSAALSPDGHRVVTLINERTAQVWEVATGRPIGGLLRHAGRLRVLLFSPDGRRVLTGGEDQFVRLWDALNGKTLLPPLPHSAAVTFAAFGPNGRRLVTGCADGTARRWDMGTGRSAGPPARTGAHALALSPDGRWLVTGSIGGGRLWNLATGRALPTLLKHAHQVGSAAFSPDGRRIVTGGWDSVAQVWDATTGAPVTPPLRHRSRVFVTSFSPDGRWVVTGSRDDTVRIWDAATGGPVGPSLPHAGWVTSAAFTPEGRRLLTADAEGAARIWDLATVEDDIPPLQERGAVYHADFSSDGTRFATANMGGRCRVWSALTGAPVGPELQHPGALRILFSPDNRRVLISGGGTARVWDWAAGRPVTPPLSQKDPAVWIAGPTAFSPDGRWVLTAGEDGIAQVWDAETGTRIGPGLRHSASIRTAVFHPKGTRVLTAAADGTVHSWSVPGGQPVTPVIETEAIRGSTGTAAFSPDCRRLVTITGQAERLARLWDVASGARATPPLIHGAEITNLAFSRDGRRVVTSSWDGSAQVWDAATGELLIAPLEHAGRVGHASFSREATYVATASFDRTARVWDGTTGEAITPPLWHPGMMLGAFLSPNGESVVTGSEGEGATLRLWRFPPDPRPAGDLLQLSRLLSCRQVDLRAGTTLLKPAALRAAWRDLRERYPGDFSVTPGQARQWHQRQAKACDAQGLRAAARSHQAQLRVALRDGTPAGETGNATPSSASRLESGLTHR